MADKYLLVGDSDYRGPEPMAYRLHASAFLDCAENSISRCWERCGRDPNMMECVPIIHLVCHAIEMLLKLALYKTGSDDKALKLLYLRHNLSKLKSECEKTGVLFSNDVSALIGDLSPLHERHALRYTAFVEPGVWLRYNPSEMVSISRKLIGASHPSQSA